MFLKMGITTYLLKISDKIQLNSVEKLIYVGESIL